jgi:hypothetical protein
MIQSKEIQAESYYQAIGVIRGTPKADIPANGKNRRFWINYHGRDYPLLPSNSRFEQSSRFDLNKERLFLVYPQPRTYKPFALLNRDYGYNRSQALLGVKHGLTQLYKTDQWCNKFLRETPILFRQSRSTNMDEWLTGDGSPRFNIDDLFDPCVEVKNEELKKSSYYLFLMLKKLLNEQNTRPSPQAKEIGFRVLSLLNGGLCDQLYHPGTERSQRTKAFAANWRRSRTFAKNAGISSFKKMFYSLSFALVAFSDEESFFVDSIGRNMQDGEFLLSGSWSPWVQDLDEEEALCLDKPRYATFSSHLNRNSPRNFSKTAIQSCSVPKRLIIHQNSSAHEIKRDCYGSAIAAFDPFYNTFSIKEFQEVGKMPAPLKAEELIALQKKQGKPKAK